MAVDQTEFNSFQRLERGLHELGLVDDARWLYRSRTCAYPTSSERYGELGAVVRSIHRSISRDAARSLRGLFDECEHTIRLVWPNFNLRDDA
jgi:hypothetical protein